MSVVLCVLKQREIPAGGKMHKNDTEYSYIQGHSAPKRTLWAQRASTTIARKTCLCVALKPDTYHVHMCQTIHAPGSSDQLDRYRHWRPYTYRPNSSTAGHLYLHLSCGHTAASCMQQPMSTDTAHRKGKSTRVCVKYG